MKSHSRAHARKQSARHEPLGWRPEIGLSTDLLERSAEPIPGDTSLKGSKPWAPRAKDELHAPPIDKRKERREAAKKAPATLGRGWFDLPAPKMDDELERELKLIRLRGAFDPKRFYKTLDSKKLPTHFQIGTVVNGPADFYSGRLTKSEARNTSIAKQLLVDSEVSHYRKKRFNSMQEEAEQNSAKRRKTGKKWKKPGRGLKR